MNILWVSHTMFQAGVRARAEYFIERLADEHTVHVLCWDVPIRRTPAGIISTLRSWSRRHGRIHLHHLPRLPLSFDGGPPLFTKTIFHRTLRRLVREHSIDLVICACNWYALGFPPDDLSVPLLIDYFDLLQDHHEARYLEHCDGVICSSSVLYDRATKYKSPAYYVPNGIETHLFIGADGTAVRREYDLENARVVSLIGLTASPSLYFLDAIEIIARQQPNVRGLIVGDGDLLRPIRQKIEGREHLFRLTGAIPYERIPQLFAASDVGLYPADQASYFDAALPIKVLEYSAGGTPVVTPPLEEIRRLAFPNVIFAEPTVEGFVRGITAALEMEHRCPPNIAEFDVAYLAGRLNDVVKDATHRVRCARTKASARGEGEATRVHRAIE